MSQADEYLVVAKDKLRAQSCGKIPDLEEAALQYRLEISAGVKASSRQIPLVQSCSGLAGELKDLGNAALHLHRIGFNLVVV